MRNALSQNTKPAVIGALRPFGPFGTLGKLSAEMWLEINQFSPKWWIRKTAEGREEEVKSKYGPWYEVCRPLSDVIWRVSLQRIKKMVNAQPLEENPSRDSALITYSRHSTLNAYCIFQKLLLVEKNANHKDSEGFTALHTAAGVGNDSAVKLLLERPDIDVNTTTPAGQTPLYLAACNGHEAVVKSLLAHPDIRLDITANNGHTPLALINVQIARPTLPAPQRQVYEAIAQLLQSKAPVPSTKSVSSPRPARQKNKILASLTVPL